ncbi:hypothetical protein BGZ59_008440 [Podila verticillata]|nr:hypothetical protein BGZ59_008440 [Podila verticillata]
MLKGHWASLKKLSIAIRKGAAKTEQDSTRAIDWIHGCIILHNFLIEENDVTEFTDLFCLQHVGDQVPGNPQYAFDVEENQSGLLFRQRVMENVLHAGRGPTGIITHERQRAGRGKARA